MRFEQQAYNTAYIAVMRGGIRKGTTIDSYNQKVNYSQISPTLTTRPEGFKTAILLVELYETNTD